MGEAEHAELPLRGRSAGRGGLLPREDEGIPQTGKEKNDYRGKHDGHFGKRRELFHPFDRKSGNGKMKDYKGGHGKGNWGDMRDEIVGQLERGEDELIPQAEQEFEKIEMIDAQIEGEES